MRGETDNIVRWFELLHWQQGKWVLEIVLVLIHGPARFQDLSRAINAHHIDRWWNPRPSRLSNSQLSRTLQTMHRDELVVRVEDHTQAPTAVTYALSPLFRDFLTNAIEPAAEWLRHHDEHIHRIRARHHPQHNS
jgi:DNA-binding HxlR family transcriptional regulator